MDFTSLFKTLNLGIGILYPICGAVILLFVLGMLALWVVRSNKRPQAVRSAADDWLAVNALILSSALYWRHQPGGGSYQEAVIVYQYQVNEQTYQSRTVRAGEKAQLVRAPGEERARVDNYPAGSKVTAFYNPLNPAEAVLEK